MKLAPLLLLLLAPFNVFAAEPFATATIDSGERLVVGQQVHLTVSVFAPDFFTSPPQFALFDLPNALVTLPEERAQNFVQTIDGTQYSGIRRRYAIVPEVPGTYDVPPIDIELGYSIGGKSVHATAITPAVSFTAYGSTNSATEATLAARNLTVEQTFDKDTTSLKQGDALVRTIMITAEDTQAILLPPINAQNVSGLKQYVKSPALDDDVEIGRETASRRTETIVYIASATGHFILPAIDYPWFDLDTNGMTKAHLQPIQIEIGAGPPRSGIAPDQPSATPPSSFEKRRRDMVGIGLFLVLAALLWKMRDLPRAVMRGLAGARERIKASRWYRLNRLRQTILSASLPEVYAALQEWSGSEGFRTLHDWANARHPDLVADLDILENTLYSDGRGNFDRRRVAAIIHHSSPPRESVRSRHTLPELNPGPGPERSAFTRR